MESSQSGGLDAARAPDVVDNEFDLSRRWRAGERGLSVTRALGDMDNEHEARRVESSEGGLASRSTGDGELARGGLGAARVLGDVENEHEARRRRLENREGRVGKSNERSAKRNN